MESLLLLRTCTVTMNRLEKLRRSAMSIVANAPCSFPKLRRSAMSGTCVLESALSNGLLDKTVFLNNVFSLGFRFQPLG
jgi:hypothetical protein